MMPQLFTFDQTIPSAEARPFKTHEAQHAEKNAPQNHSHADHADRQTDVLDDLGAFSVLGTDTRRSTLTWRRSKTTRGR